jgi:hypothetical protein
MAKKSASILLRILPYVCLAVLQFLLLYPLHTTMDLPLWDEANYMGWGEQFLHSGTLGPVSGSPVYILLYSMFVELFGTIDSIFYMQYFLKIGTIILFISFLIQHLQSRLLALLLTMIWAISSINIWSTVLVYHLALGIFLLALIFLDQNRIATSILLWLCALTRLEYVFLALAYNGYLIVVGTISWKNKKLEPISSIFSINFEKFVVLILTIFLLESF